MNKKVCLITATCNRHKCIERSVGMFLAQDYEGEHIQLIFNNADEPLELDTGEIAKNKKIILVNSCNKGYRSLGEIYNDALNYIPDDVDIVSHLDDDDMILPDHITEGVRGFNSGNKLAYKPKYSYYRSSEGISLVENTLEPSIFVYSDFLTCTGYSDTTSDQHLKWVNKLIANYDLFTDWTGKPTLIYNWGDNFPTFKTSGDPHNPNNFNNYRKNSKDKGDGIITPLSPVEINKLYKQIKDDIIS